MKAQRPECKWQKRLHGFRHAALTGVRLADPIAERCCLCRAAADVRQSNATEKRIVRRIGYEIRIAKIVAHVFGVGAQPPAVHLPRKVIA